MGRTLLPLVLVAACAAGCTATQETGTTPSREGLLALCETALCREPGIVRVTLDDGRQQETHFDLPRPIVLDGTQATIHPGETVYLEADVDGNRLVNLRAVEAITNPARTIELEMRQDGGKPDTFLTVRNPFPRPLKYHLRMILPDSDELIGTSSCPVPPDGLTAFEFWPQAIFQLVLSEPRLLSANSGDFSCEY